MKKIVLVAVMFILILMVGCQTAAQRQLSLIQENSKITLQKMSACVQKIELNPAYQSLAEHTPLKGGVNPTLMQLADNSLPSDDDIRLIVAMHNETELCRVQAIEDCMKFLPGIVPITVQAYHAVDLNTVDLIQRKITWGEYNKRWLALRDDYMAKMQAYGAQLDKQLSASHQSELAQRQAAFNALSQWAYQQQILMQNQQLINSSNQPHMTHCTMVPDGHGNLTGNCQ